MTIVWFEGENGVPSNLISRKLFVDVNTQAKTVSKSRNILLNDTEIASISVTSFYGNLARIGYSLDRLSLLHSGFDCDGSFPQEFPKMTIFSPSTLHYSLSYFLLARPDRIELGTSITNDSYGNFKTYHERLKDICSGLTDELIAKVQAGDSQALLAVDELFTENIATKLYKIFDKFGFLTPHFGACKNLDEQISNSGAVEIAGAWSKVFRGGEGLYNAFNEAAASEGVLAGRLSTYKTAVDKINSDFLELRDGHLPNYSNAFTTFTSKAGLTGYLMALLSAFEEEGWTDLLIEKFIGAVNEYSVEEWITILTDYKKVIQPENSPKLWPNMRHIYLRFIEQKVEGWEFFNQTSLEKFHPDWRYCNNLVLVSLKSYFEADDENEPDSTTKSLWIESSIQNLTDCLSKVNVEPYTESLIRQKLADSLDAEINKRYKKDSDEDE